MESPAYLWNVVSIFYEPRAETPIRADPATMAPPFQTWLPTGAAGIAVVRFDDTAHRAASRLQPAGPQRASRGGIFIDTGPHDPS